MPEQTLNRPHYRRTLAITALALAVLLILGIRFGSTRLDLALIAHGISGTLTPEEAPHWYAFHQMRLPRALATALVGGTLASCGAVMQGLFRNPLVDPGIIGVMSGAAFSVTLYIVIGAEAFPALLHWLGDYALPVAAFAGSWLMTLTLYRFAKRGGQINIAAMLLIGIALSGFTGAITGLLTYIADDNQLRSLTFWGMGTLSKMDWQKLAILAAISAISLPWIHQDARVLNALMLGESAAYHLGFNIGGALIAAQRQHPPPRERQGSEQEPTHKTKLPNHFPSTHNQENTMNQNQDPRDSLARQPGQVLEALAAEYQTSLETVLQSLPAEMWQKTEGTRILDILQTIATWEHPVTTIIHTPDIIAEISGRLPGGRVARGYYNFDKNPDGSGIHSRLLHEHCAAIYRVERPFMGTATAALYFINHSGGCICKIFAGRDQNRELRPEQVAAMRALVP